AIAQTGTSLPHGQSYGLTYGLGVPHGKACGQFLAGYLNEADPEDAGTVMNAAGFDSPADLHGFIMDLCGGVEVPSDLLDTMLDQLAGNPAKLRNAPFPADREVLRRIAEFRGDR
ncbi:MAG: iron-containing alcohol dehydrogenase, partial [Clostridia bacterium]|nr:iron-containing alcohol dehydrogenase [Clostridia bacterium]